MPYVAMTKEKWIQTVRDNEEVLRELIRDWHPVSRITNHRASEFVAFDGDLVEIAKPSMPITAPGAEAACGVVRNKIIAEEGGKDDPVNRFNKALDGEDLGEINSLLSSAWFGVPESSSCWSIPGFSVACDLMDDMPEEEEG